MMLKHKNTAEKLPPNQVVGNLDDLHKQYFRSVGPTPTTFFDDTLKKTQTDIERTSKDRDTYFDDRLKGVEKEEEPKEKPKERKFGGDFSSPGFMKENYHK